jgi:hypothetical protein
LYDDVDYRREYKADADKRDYGSKGNLQLRGTKYVEVVARAALITSP